MSRSAVDPFDRAVRQPDRALHLVTQAGLGRYSQDAEAALYFCVLEALQNIAKYARATTAHVLLCDDEGKGVTFTVEDDGIGFDQASRPTGSGLQGMSDRLAALGGTLEIASTPGRGTRVTGRIPALALADRPVPVALLLPAAAVLPAAVLPAVPVD